MRPKLREGGSLDSACARWDSSAAWVAAASARRGGPVAIENCSCESRSRSRPGGRSYDDAGDFVAFFVDIQTDVFMMWLHELACGGLFGLRFTNLVARHPTSLPDATHANNGGKLLLLGAKTPAAFHFTQPFCLGHEAVRTRIIKARHPSVARSLSAGDAVSDRA